MSQQNHQDAYRGTPPQNYERYFVPAIGAPLADDLVETAALRPGERVLDVACGTGVVARFASEKVGAGGKVSGLDINPGMLAVARAASPGEAIEWHEASAEELPFPDASFDAVLCQIGLQFVPDKTAALGEMRRVLATGGRAVVNAPGPEPEMFAILSGALAKHIGPDAAGFVKAVFSLDDTSALEGLFRSAGFEDVSVRAETETLQLPAPEEFLWQYIYGTPLAAIVGQVSEEPRRALERDTVEKWQDIVEDGNLMLDVRMITAMARR
jgi:ubiquinone/menaquinone biosynthesis C-methylase UbiE